MNSVLTRNQCVITFGQATYTEIAEQISPGIGLLLIDILINFTHFGDLG